MRKSVGGNRIPAMLELIATPGDFSASLAPLLTCTAPDGECANDKGRLDAGLFVLVGGARFELATNGLKVRCSTN